MYPLHLWLPWTEALLCRVLFWSRTSPCHFTDYRRCRNGLPTGKYRFFLLYTSMGNLYSSRFRFLGARSYSHLCYLPLDIRTAPKRLIHYSPTAWEMLWFCLFSSGYFTINRTYGNQSAHPLPNINRINHNYALLSILSSSAQILSFQNLPILGEVFLSAGKSSIHENPN